jgi:hypothetical protein
MKGETFIKVGGTVDEWIKNRLEAGRLAPKSGRQNDGESVSRVHLLIPESVFSLQCSCGVKHQLRYTEGREAPRLHLVEEAESTPQGSKAPMPEAPPGLQRDICHSSSNSLPNVKVHTPLPASASAETGVNP